MNQPIEQNHRDAAEKLARWFLSPLMTEDRKMWNKTIPHFEQILANAFPTTARELLKQARFCASTGWDSEPEKLVQAIDAYLNTSEESLKTEDGTASSPAKHECPRCTRPLREEGCPTCGYWVYGKICTHCGKTLDSQHGGTCLKVETTGVTTELLAERTGVVARKDQDTHVNAPSAGSAHCGSYGALSGESASTAQGFQAGSNPAESTNLSSGYQAGQRKDIEPFKAGEDADAITKAAPLLAQEPLTKKDD